MIETWRDSWFEGGSRLIYILPHHPQSCPSFRCRSSPAPSRTVRVFVGRIELVIRRPDKLWNQPLLNSDGRRWIATTVFLTRF